MARALDVARRTIFLAGTVGRFARRFLVATIADLLDPQP